MASTATTILDTQAQTLRAMVDAALDEYTSFDRGCPERLGEAIRYSLLAPGKRLRPLLVMWAAKACGSDPKEVLPAACAVEMIHAYSLIHDDLPAMDDDDLRRGRPTCHKQFDEATAILAGDALLALAFEVLSEDIEQSDHAAACCGVLAHAAGACELVGGQADDLAGEFFSGGLDVLESIHRRKTGALMKACLQLGAICSDASNSEREALDAYGKNLGLAFQVVDDLLDAQGDAATVGKQTGKDAQRGKLTYPGLLGIEESTRRATALVDAACEALKPFGKQAAELEALARYVLERNQ